MGERRKRVASCCIPTSNKELPLHWEDIPGNVITFPKKKPTNAKMKKRKHTRRNFLARYFLFPTLPGVSHLKRNKKITGLKKINAGL